MAETATLAAPTVADRVAAGAAWLDARDPGWWREDAPAWPGNPESGPIDLAGLRMQNPCWCVLGQRYGHFANAPIPLDQAVALGFDADDLRGRNWSVAQDYRALGVEWERVITERRDLEAALVRGVTSDGA